MNDRSLGQHGEDLAACYLEGKGYRVVEKNFRNRLGEIDLIAKDGKMICFVEVKTRRSLSCGMPYESVHRQKQRKIARVAQSYMMLRFGTCDILARFDVVSIYKDPTGQFRLEHLQDAFDVVP